MSGTLGADDPLPTVEVEGERPAARLGRRDRDVEYEEKPRALVPQQRLRPNVPPDTVTLEIDGKRFTGWQDVRIVRGMEVFPSHFVLRLTERLPDQPTLLAIDPGQTCRLWIGGDLVLTGYIDTYGAQVSARGHEVTVSGRSGTEDLVDAAAGVEEGKETQATMTFRASSLLTLAQDLCRPLGIAVTAPDGEGEPIVSVGSGIPQFTIALGTPAYDVLEIYARVRQRILMDSTDGNLLIAAVGTTKAASGFTLPGSVITAQVGFSKQDRFTVYLPAQFTFDSAGDVSAAAQMASGNYFAPVKDEAAFAGQKRLDGQARYRPRFVVSEQAQDNVFLCELRAKWQKARDYGRSQAVTAAVALWRDSAGTLWAPNTLAPVDMPALKLPKLTWIISQVVYLKGFGGGTRTVTTLMPPEAFQPEPTFYTPFDPQISAAASSEAFARRKQAGQVQADGSRSISNPGAGAGGNPQRGDAPGV